MSVQDPLKPLPEESRVALASSGGHWCPLILRRLSPRAWGLTPRAVPSSARARIKGYLSMEVKRAWAGSGSADKQGRSACLHPFILNIAESSGALLAEEQSHHRQTKTQDELFIYRQNIRVGITWECSRLLHLSL